MHEALARELDAVRSAVERLALELCLDPEVFSRHVEALQSFDALAQVIGEVSNLLRHPGEDDAAIASIRLDDMRQRMSAALS